MDKQGNRGILSGILGTSNISHKQNKEILISEDSGILTDQTSNSREGIQQSPYQNMGESNSEERHKLHRLGSYIDWGASKFDFSNTSSNIDIGENQTVLNYNSGASKTSFIPSDDNFQIPLSAYKKIDHTNMRKRSNSSAQRRKSLLDTSEDEKIDGAAQAFLSGSPASRSPPINILSSDHSNRERIEDHTVLEGLMGSWFFRNKTIDEDDALSIQKQAQIPMEGIGGGALTSRIMNELKINSNSKPEVEKMNTWAPASF